MWLPTMVRRTLGAPTAEESSESLISVYWIVFSIPPRHSLNPLSGHHLGPGQYLLCTSAAATANEPMSLLVHMQPHKWPCYMRAYMSCVCVRATSLQSCPTLWDSMNCSLPGSSVHGFPRQEYWSGLPCLPPGDVPNPGIKPTSLMSPALAGKFFATTALEWV